MKHLRFLFLLILFISFSTFSFADNLTNTKTVDLVYFYGDGCPHCAKLEMFLDEIRQDYSLNIISYEVSHNQSNMQLGSSMAAKYGTMFTSVPLIFISDKYLVGFSDKIGEEIKSEIERCSLECCESPLETLTLCGEVIEPQKTITVWAAISLALADAVNPCEFAVLTMVLVALLAHDPKKRKNVLLGGLAFTLAIFLTYLLYGIIIVQSFKFVQTSISSISPFIRIIFASLAVLLGLMNLMDYFRYKPGTIGTEMPMFLRPRVKHLIQNITRPRGAFLIGIVVTLFLLPCTMGPYIVAGNLLSTLSLINAIPWLVMYNLIFVMPMIIITLIVYFGYSTVENVSGWKEEHIRVLHLISGAILVLLGILMLLGWI